MCEAMVKDMGWTGKCSWTGSKAIWKQKLCRDRAVKNFNFRPFKEEVNPNVSPVCEYEPYKFFVRVKPGNPAPALAAMQKAWTGVVADLPFKYSFLDESLDNFYKTEKKWSNIIGWAGGISVFLACLGLFGLAALAAVNRTKEIGIRKVLGASVTGIIGLISKDFLKLVIIAFIIASPLAWYFMNKWLQDFEYRISITVWIFIIAGVSAVLIALATVTMQAMKAALSNPVKSLRTE
jgi:putative ABC transport system permease protein